MGDRKTARSETDFIVLGAGRPTGFSGQSPHANTGKGRASIDWVREATKHFTDTRFFVAGYAAEHTSLTLPDFNIVFNPRWDETGSAASLLCVPAMPGRQALVCYADIVFRESIVRSLMTGTADITIAVDTEWLRRYEGRTAHDLEVAEKVVFKKDGSVAIGRSYAVADAGAEFTGLVRFSERATAILRRPDAVAPEIRENGSLADLIGHLALCHGLTLTHFDVEGDWAELNAPQDLARFVLGTKAETLDRLRPLVRVMQIEDQLRFTVRDWIDDAGSVLAALARRFLDGNVIVRSSARREDGWRSANAGAFASVLHVSAVCSEAVSAAIEKVIASYGDPDAGDQILVQPMLTGVVASGVVFTRTLSAGAPYFVINYDETEGRTDAVTSGDSAPYIFYMHHDADAPPTGAPPWAAALIAGVRELIRLVGYDTLDMEFAVTDQGKIVLLQLRPIAVDHQEWAISDELLKSEIEEARERYRALALPTGDFSGGRPVFGVMPDWNPAEILGSRPALLTTSLYRYLICDDVWATQRAEYGYHDVRPQPLLASFAGRPYINVRASFRSFVPASVPPDLANRLVDHYVSRLLAEPALHDKIEFAIAFTCLSFDFDARARAELEPAGFSPSDIQTLRDGLAEVTRNGLLRYPRDNDMISVLAKRFTKIMDKSLDPLSRASALLEDCRRYGTLPFAHLARAGFVAATLLRSAVTEGFIDQSFYDRYLRSINTVAKRFVHDSAAVASGQMTWSVFLQRYGHLRPGTYDILSPSYRDNGGELLKHVVANVAAADRPELREAAVEWPAGSWLRMQNWLRQSGVDVEFEAFDSFLRAGIEGREYSKLIFTQNVSAALDSISEFGETIGVPRALLADVPIEAYFAVRAGEGFGNAGTFIRATAAHYQPRKLVALNAELPPLIHDESHFYAFSYVRSVPNFITSKVCQAEICFLAVHAPLSPDEVRGKIVVVAQADPGFDWLFGCEIAGLMTMYGGANSHMAIRAAEFGTPAAIGVGEAQFEVFKTSKIVILDCLKRKIDIVC